MRLSLLLALAVAALAVGCGQAADTAGNAPAGSTQVVTGPEREEPQAPGLRPPDILLVSEAGTQVGVPGSYCVTDPAAGTGVCADNARRPEAKQANVVRPGENVTIALDGARVARGEGCHARDLSCIGEILASPAGCKAKGGVAARVFLRRGDEMEWKAPLEPGPYELELYYYFEAEDGRSGDSSAALGLVVHPTAELAVIPMPKTPADCP